MSDDNLAKRVEELENKLGILEDVHAVRRLHHLYGYFLDKCMYDEVVDCYADDCEFYFFGGVFKGKAGIRRAYCDGFRQRFTDGKNGPVFGFLLDHPMMQDVVDVAPDRKTANARFRCMMMAGTHYEKDPRPALAGTSSQWWEGALYENSYIKIDGVWRIKVLNYRPVWHATHENGWAYTPPHFVPNKTATYPDDPYGPDELTEIKPLLWPEHEVLPFHCEHPVTGKPIVTPEPGLKPE